MKIKNLLYAGLIAVFALTGCARSGAASAAQTSASQTTAAGGTGEGKRRAGIALRTGKEKKQD